MTHLTRLPALVSASAVLVGAMSLPAAPASASATCPGGYATYTVAGSTVCEVKFTTVGANTWVRPLGVTSVDVVIVGAGGGGGGGYIDATYTNAGSGGGGGRVVVATGVPVAGASVAVTVGTPGAAGPVYDPGFTTTTATDGSAGGASAFGALSAAGGGGGAGGRADSTGTGGASGNSVNSASTSYTGGAVRVMAKWSGVGGGGAGAGQDGYAGSDASKPGYGGNGVQATAGLFAGATAYYGGGGGGGGVNNTDPGTGGTGGGATGWKSSAGRSADSGTANTGGGGGGGAPYGGTGMNNPANYVGFGGQGGSGLVIVRFIAVKAPSAPTGLIATAGNGSVSVAFTEGGNGGSPLTNYEYSLDNGTWTPLSPAATTSPVSIPGLTNGTTYSVRLRAVNEVDSSAASTSVSVTPVAPPTPPAPDGGGSNPAPEPTPTPTPTPTSAPTAAASAPADPLAPIESGRNAALPPSGLPAGGSLLLVNGQPAAVSVRANSKVDPVGLVITGPGLTMRLEGRGDSQAPLGLTGQQALVLQSQEQLRTRALTLGKRVQPVAKSSGDGFMPSSAVRFYLLPNMILGSLQTDSSGSYAGTVPIPAGIAPGTYTLQVNGFAPDSSVRSLSLGVEVVATSARAKAVERAATVRFEALSDQLTPRAKAELRALVKRTGKTASRVVSVGYVQESGTATNDESLSTARARAVALYLRSIGVTGSYVVRGDGIGGSGMAERKVVVTVRA